MVNPETLKYNDFKPFWDLLVYLQLKIKIMKQYHDLLRKILGEGG
jgi:hypothetical protein